MNADFTTLCDEIAGMLRDLRRVIVALDGPDDERTKALTARLADHFGSCAVVPLSDFRLPDAPSEDPDAPPETLIDFERFTRDVADPLWRALTPTYVPASGEGSEPARVCFDSTTTLYVIAGTYSHHPAIPDVYDLRVFVEVPAAPAQATASACPAPSAADRYFASYLIRELSDLLCAGDGGDAYIPLPDEPRSMTVETVDMSGLLPYRSDPKEQ